LNERLDPRLEIGVALLMIVISATALFGTMDIPPGKFEPLGSAPVPQAVAGLIIILALGLIVRACIDRRPLATAAADRYLDATAVVVLTLLFVAAMNYRLATFAVLTSVYLIVTVGFLTRFKRRSLPAVIAVALITGFGCQYVFTRIFVVDLPGL